MIGVILLFYSCCRYWVFAELLNGSSIMLILSDWYQHPGYYYHASAAAAKKRKVIADKIRAKSSENSLKTLSAQELESFTRIYVGQTPVRALEPNEEKKPQAIEQEKALYLETLERKFNHTERIILLLNRASEQFQKPPRMDRILLHIYTMMAEEYMAQSNFEKAKQLCDQVLESYKQDEWFSIVKNVYTLSLKCANNLRNVRDFSKFSIELLSPAFQMKSFERDQIFADFKDLFKPISPLMGFHLYINEPLHLDIEGSHSFIDCKAQFEKVVNHVNTEVTLLLRVQSSAPEKISLSSLSIHFNEAAYDQVLTARDETTPITDLEQPGIASPKDLLTLPPMTARVLKFTFLVRDCINLESTYVKAVIGDDPVSIHLKIPMTLPHSPKKISPDEVGSVASKDMKTFKERPATTVVQPRSRLLMEITHRPPALVNELYKLEITLTSRDQEIISGVLQIDEQDTGTLLNSKESILYKNDGESLDPVITIPRLDVGQKTSFVVFAKCSYVCQKKLIFKASYVTGQNFKEAGEEIQTLAFEFPFHTRFSLVSGMSNSPQVADSAEMMLSLGHSSLLQIEAECHVQYPIKVFKAELIQGVKDFVQFDCGLREETDAALQGQLPLRELRKGDKLTLSIPLVPLHIASRIPLGLIKLFWRRASSETEENVALLQLPQVSVSKNLLDVEVDIPPTASVAVPLLVHINIKNNTGLVQDLSLNATDSEAFIFSGTRSAKFSIIPHGSRRVSFVLVPLATGHAVLPKVQLTSLRYNREEITSMKDRAIFVYPIHNP
eukprot:TRINITY_DN8040_c0_g2_i5.p1 TRINITY_DN8040_c0_g2~~TRINITY_DN8040_c0_g2_i5.p1  ORF type:complete len:784 (+),score=158.51 TRINITY_DN8040_c0_g2_i5:76-2427(+)